MRKSLSKKSKIIYVFVTVLAIVLIVLASIFLPKSCLKKNDVSKKPQIEKQDMTKKAINNTKGNEVLLLKIDSLQKALNACQGEKLIAKKPITKKTITKRKVIKKIAKPKILAAPIIVVAPKENKEVELSLNGITIEKKVIPQKKETPKIIAPKIVVVPTEEPTSSNCPTCKTQYGNTGKVWAKYRRK